MKEGMINKGIRADYLKCMAVAAMVLLLMGSCNSNSFEGQVVAVEVEDLLAGPIEKANLIVLDPAKPDRSPKLLSKDFASACAPALSFEGRYLYFQGKKSSGDPWQIWVLDLHKNSTQRVTDLPEDCFHPAALPDGTVIFSKSIDQSSSPQRALYRCQRDGSDLKRVTFNPGEDLHPTVLDEGRVLYLSRQRQPEAKAAKILIMRPDGTKSELYYPGYMGQQAISGGVEAEGGFIYFIQEDGSLSRVNHTRPLFTRKNLSTDLPGTFSSVYPYQESELLVSYRPGAEELFGLYRFSPDSQEEPELLYKGVKDVTDPVWVRALEERPRILPSAVNLHKSTGLLMSQNINHSRLPLHADLKGDSSARQIRVLGLDGIVGEADVEADGSVYLVLDADTPVRIETLNSQGEVVRGPSDWIYLRPNERRACVGCHADPELAPDNTQPMAVKAAPVDLSTRKENTEN